MWPVMIHKMFLTTTGLAQQLPCIIQASSNPGKGLIIQPPLGIGPARHAEKAAQLAGSPTSYLHPMEFNLQDNPLWFISLPCPRISSRY